MTTTANLSKDRLARLHDILAGHVRQGAVPGLVSVVSRRGEADIDAIGMTALGGSQPARPDTIFRISSMTKPITARRDADPPRGVRPAPRRARRPAPARARRPSGRAPHRRAGGRHRAGPPADHRARPAHLPDGLRRVLRAVPGERRRRATPAQRRAAAAVAASRARRVDAPILDPAAHVPARRALAVPHRRRRARRAHRPGQRPAVRDVPARAGLRAAGHEGHGLLRHGR